MDPTNIIISAVSGILGACLPIVASFFIGMFKAKKKADLAQVTVLFAQAKTEREAIFQQQHKITNDLQAQIFDLRQQVIQLQQDNIICARENAELRARVTTLTEDNIELRTKVKELESEIAVLRAQSFFPSK